MSDENNSGLKFVLKQIYEVNKRYEELAKLSGENFNIFKILGLSSKELSHSAFIASLLNPTGSHGKGEIFLRLFLEEIDISDFSPVGTKVRVEKYIGPIDQRNKTGGRIDIVLSDNKNNKILIENKIYAEDQESQLLRYHNYGEKHGEKSILIYLTLDGKEASSESLGKSDKESYKPFSYKCLSYKYDVMNWLEKCKKEVADVPFVREVISQYIVLIKRLTGQTRSRLMKKETIDILMRDDKYIEAAFDIVKGIESLKVSLIGSKLEPKLLEIATEYNLRFSFKKKYKCDVKYWGFYFEKEEWANLRLQFEFQRNGFKEFVYGFRYIDDSQKLSNNLEPIFLNKESKNKTKWPLCKPMKRFENWNNDFFVKLIKEEELEDIVSEIENRIQEMLSILPEEGA